MWSGYQTYSKGSDLVCFGVIPNVDGVVLHQFLAVCVGVNVDQPCYDVAAHVASHLFTFVHEGDFSATMWLVVGCPHHFTIT